MKFDSDKITSLASNTFALPGPTSVSGLPFAIPIYLSGVLMVGEGECYFSLLLSITSLAAQYGATPLPACLQTTINNFRWSYREHGTSIFVENTRKLAKLYFVIRRFISFLSPLIYNRRLL
jgi:hypothetical protein